jgi:hypothetical protein
MGKGKTWLFFLYTVDENESFPILKFLSGRVASCLRIYLSLWWMGHGVSCWKEAGGPEKPENQPEMLLNHPCGPDRRTGRK